MSRSRKKAIAGDPHGDLVAFIVKHKRRSDHENEDLHALRMPCVRLDDSSVQLLRAAVARKVGSEFFNMCLDIALYWRSLLCINGFFRVMLRCSSRLCQKTRTTALPGRRLC